MNLWRERKRATAAACNASEQSELANFATQEHIPPRPKALTCRLLGDGRAVIREWLVTAEDIERLVPPNQALFGAKKAAELRNAHAGAYALVMAAQGIHDDSEREAISFVARGVERVLGEITKALVEATGHSEPTPTRPVESTPPRPVERTPPRVVEPDTA